MTRNATTILTALSLLLASVIPCVSASAVPPSSSAESVASTGTTLASPNSERETTFHTANGLRFVDTEAFEAKLASSQTLADEEAILAELGAQYGLTFSIESGTPSAEARQEAAWSYLNVEDAQALKRYAALFIDEWSKYPRAWIQATGLRTIVFVKRLDVGGQGRYAMPEPSGKALYLQADLSHVGSADYLRSTIHHEFDHYVEYALFRSYNHYDAKWVSCNPPNFRYGNGGTSAYVGQFVNSPHPIGGFVTAYAITAIEEDKAEIYAYLFTTARYHTLAGWIQTDPLLSSKVAEYKALIQKQVPFMDDAYFAAINPEVRAPR